MSLLDDHRTLLTASAINDETAGQRGYWSATRPGELNGRFTGQQKRPGLVIPVWDVYGKQPFCQLRPDEPREKDGKVIKYETPVKARMVLDVPPASRASLGNPKVTLWITEGIRKADSLVSVGLTAIALLGVENWRGTNEHGGKTALADWHEIALNDRRVVLCFDSDAFQKHEVHAAVDRFGRWLERRNAQPCFVYLPSDGGKVGVDDYLAAGHSKEELVALLERKWRPLPSSARPKPKPKQPSVPPPLARVLLDDVAAFIRRFVVLPSDASYLALSLFALHTWAIEAAHATPYVVVESPEKQSGKTRLLEVLGLVCRNPLKTSSITAAALFQSIAHGKPTLLIDEADAIFGGGGERNEELRGVLNAGNAPGSPVIRGGKDGTPVSYDVFCPKVIAGIATGKLPDTIRDRAVVIPIDRKLRSERVERMRRHRLLEELEKLRSGLEAWADQGHEHLFGYDMPEPLEAISDRLEEAWEPLLAIADLAGGEYPDRARSAALDLASDGDDEATASHTLLMTLTDVFKGQSVMFSQNICTLLNANDELPFGSWNDGKGIKPVELGRLLKRYRIKPRTVRMGGVTAKGYHRKPFETVWERYGADFAATPVTFQQTRGFSKDPQPSQDSKCDGSPGPENPDQIRQVTGVTAKSARSCSPRGPQPFANNVSDEDQERAERLIKEYGDTDDPVS